MNLNDSQLRAVDHFDGPCLCLAGPGSGKTAVIIARINRLIERGINPDKICVITFTKSAAKEMQARFNNSKSYGHNVTFGTFHSLFWGILSSEKKLKYDDILMGSKKSNILREATLKADFDNDIEIYSLVEREISYIKNNNIDINSYISQSLESEKLKITFYEYEKLKRKYGLYDFDDMLTSTYDMFIKEPHILKKWRGRFDYFLVDEMQDMNSIQFKLISQLAGNNNNLFMVGDEDQSIYGFRGANPKLIFDLDNYYPNLTRILLDTNYRCPNNILKASLSLINNNKERQVKNITGVKDGGFIDIYSAKNSSLEASSIIDKIKELKSIGYEYDQISILYRNHSNASYIVDALVSNNIPIYLKERMPNIYSNYVIEDIMDYFQIASGNSTRKRMLSIMNKPNRYILRQSIECGYNFSDIKKFYSGNRMMQIKIDAFEKDLNLVSKMSAFAALNYIRQGMGYDQYLIEKALSHNSEPEELLEVLDFLGTTVKDCKTIEKAIEKVNYLKLKVDFENKNREQNPDGKIGLYTLHSSKGLEFPVVFMIGINEGIIPPRKSTSISEVEAERRLFYVGMTRSKDRLYISYTYEKNRDRMYPSRFLSELNYSSTKSPNASS